MSEWRKMRDDEVQAEMERLRPAFASHWPPYPNLTGRLDEMRDKYPGKDVGNWPPLPPQGPAKEPEPEPEPVLDIPCQMSFLLKEVMALQADVRDLLARLWPVMGAVMGPDGIRADGDPPPPACTPLGHDMRECEGIAYVTRRAVIDALERLQLP